MHEAILNVPDRIRSPPLTLRPVPTRKSAARPRDGDTPGRWVPARQASISLAGIPDGPGERVALGECFQACPRPDVRRQVWPVRGAKLLKARGNSRTAGTTEGILPLLAIGKFTVG